MKKKILCLVFVVAMAIVAAWNFTQSKPEVELSDLELANVEALADGETVYIYCHPAYVWVCNHSIPLYGEPIPL
jgi:hypothetical protein